MKTKEINGIKEVRTMLGLSQVKLADYLGIPRSNIAMAERNKRTLPATALLKLADLQAKANNARVDRIKILSRQDRQVQNEKFENSVALIRLRGKRSQCVLYDLYEKLNSMSRNYDVLQEWLTTTERILGINTHDERAAAFWNRQRNSILSKLSKCTLLKQDHLRLQIKLLETESEYHK